MGTEEVQFELMSDVALAVHVAHGNQRAFEVMLDRHYPVVYAIFRKKGEHQDVCRDLTHNTFVSAWLKLRSGIKVHTSLRGFLCFTALDELTKYWKRAGRYDMALDESDMTNSLTDSQEPNGLEEILHRMCRDEDRAMRRDAVLRALDSLKLRDQAILIAADVLEMPTDEIVNLFELNSPGAAYTRLGRARDKLEKAYLAEVKKSADAVAQPAAIHHASLRTRFASWLEERKARRKNHSAANAALPPTVDESGEMFVTDDAPNAAGRIELTPLGFQQMDATGTDGPIDVPTIDLPTRNGPTPSDLPGSDAQGDYDVTQTQEEGGSHESA